MVNAGIFLRKHHHIAYNKIQTLHTKQWFYLQPFSLVSLKIETSGHADNKAEAEFPVISQQIVKEIRARCDNLNPALHNKSFLPHTEFVNKTGKSEKHYRIQGRELNLYALTSLGFLPLLAGFLAVYNRASDFLPHKVIDSVFKTLAHTGIVWLIYIGTFTIILALFISYLILINRYFHFEIYRKKGQLVTSKGFLQKKIVTAQIKRIQAVIISQSFLRQLFGLATIQLMLASKAAEKESNDDLVMFPVIKNKQASKKTEEFLRWFPKEKLSYTMTGISGSWRMSRNAFLITLLFVIPLCFFVRPYGFIALVFLPFSLWLGYYTSKNTGLALTHNNILAVKKTSLLTKRNYLIPYNKIQSVTIEQSLWMKKAYLSHIKISLRNGNSQQMIKVCYLPTRTVSKVYHWYCLLQRRPKKE